MLSAIWKEEPTRPQAKRFLEIIDPVREKLIKELTESITTK